MSGFVHVAGDASQSAGATGRGGVLRIDGNASSRCGISMKGIDIVVQGSVGHMSAFMAQAGNLVVFGDAGDSLGDSIYEARLFVRGTVKSLGADCIEKPMRDEHKRALARGARPRRLQRRDRPLASSSATARRASSTISTSTTREPIDGLDAPDHPAPFGDVRRIFAVGDPPRRRDRHLRHPRRRRQAARAAFRRSAVSRRLDEPLSARRLSREMRHRCLARHPLRREADPYQDPHHHRRHELRLALGASQGSLGPRRDPGRHLDHHRRRRHDRGGAPSLAPSWSISCCPRATA